MTLDQFYEHPDAEDQIAAWEIKRETCPHHGGPISECDDPDTDWFPQRQICRAEMEEQAARRRYDLLHDDQPYHDGTFENWAKEPSLSHPYRYDDGVHIWVSDADLTPEDDFLGQGAPASTGAEAD